jgi:hypothetical protein
VATTQQIELHLPALHLVPVERGQRARPEGADPLAEHEGIARPVLLPPHDSADRVAAGGGPQHPARMGYRAQQLQRFERHPIESASVTQSGSDRSATVGGL